jgi:hypothetical protein
MKEGSRMRNNVYLEQIGFAIEDYPKAIPFIPKLDEIPRASQIDVVKV